MLRNMSFMGKRSVFVSEGQGQGQGQQSDIKRSMRTASSKYLDQSPNAPLSSKNAVEIKQIRGSKVVVVAVKGIAEDTEQKV